MDNLKRVFVVILLVSFFSILVFRLVEHIKDNKAYVATNLSEKLYTDKLEKAFYLSPSKFEDNFQINIPDFFSPIVRILKSNNIPLLISEYGEDIFTLQFKIKKDDLEYLLYKNIDLKIVEKKYKNNTFHVIDSDNDNLVFFYFKDNVATASNNYTQLKNIIDYKEEQDDTSNRLKTDFWRDLESDYKILIQEDSVELISSCTTYDTFFFWETEIFQLKQLDNLNDSAVAISESLCIDETQLYEIENIGNNIKFKIKK